MARSRETRVVGEGREQQGGVRKEGLMVALDVPLLVLKQPEEFRLDQPVVSPWLSTAPLHQLQSRDKHQPGIPVQPARQLKPCGRNLLQTSRSPDCKNVLTQSSPQTPGFSAARQTSRSVRGTNLPCAELQAAHTTPPLSAPSASEHVQVLPGNMKQVEVLQLGETGKRYLNIVFKYNSCQIYPNIHISYFSSEEVNCPDWTDWINNKKLEQRYIWHIHTNLYKNCTKSMQDELDQTQNPLSYSRGLRNSRPFLNTWIDVLDLLEYKRYFIFLIIPKIKI